MIYDFHYPSGQGKLNEDTVNCRAKQSGMMGEKIQALAPSFSFSVFALPGGKNRFCCRCEAMISPTPPNLTARRSSATVHKSRAAYSWNYPESSTCSKQTDRFHPDYITLSVQVTSVSALLSFPPHLSCVSLAHILNFLETLGTQPGHKMKTRVYITVCPYLPRI